MRIEPALRVPSVPHGRAIAAAVVGVGLLSLALHSLDISSAWAIASRPTAAVVGSTRPPADPVLAVGRVKALLSAAGLASTVAVSEGAGQGLTLSGHVDGPQAAAAWRSALINIDAAADLPPVINTVRLSEQPIQPPRITSVWFDDHPRVILADGRAVAPGETTPDGWTIVRIGPKSVDLKSPAQEPLTVTF